MNRVAVHVSVPEWLFFPFYFFAGYQREYELRTMEKPTRISRLSS